MYRNWKETWKANEVLFIYRANYVHFNSVEEHGHEGFVFCFILFYLSYVFVFCVSAFFLLLRYLSLNVFSWCQKHQRKVFCRCLWQQSKDFKDDKILPLSTTLATFFLPLSATSSKTETPVVTGKNLSAVSLTPVKNFVVQNICTNAIDTCEIFWPLSLTPSKNC